MRTRHLTDEDVQSYLEAGRFESVEQALHFRGCAACRETAERYRLLSRWLDAAEPRFALPADFITSVLARLPGPRKPRMLLRILPGSLGAAAAALLILGFQWFRPFIAVWQTASSVLNGIAEPLLAAARAFRAGGESFHYWLLMSFAVLLSAGILDAVMSHFKEVLVDKHR